MFQKIFKIFKKKYFFHPLNVSKNIQNFQKKYFCVPSNVSINIYPKVKCFQKYSKFQNFFFVYSVQCFKERFFS